MNYIFHGGQFVGTVAVIVAAVSKEYDLAFLFCFFLFIIELGEIRKALERNAK